MGTPPQRASDADREHVAERLRDAAAEGRLDPSELDERLTAAYRSKTLGELETLTVDLPAKPVPVHAPERMPAWQSRHVRERAAAFVTANVICIAIWAATGAGSFWPVWVMLGTGIALFRALVRSGFRLDQRGEAPELPGPTPGGRVGPGRRRRLS